jgi:hypothetical protein
MPAKSQQQQKFMGIVHAIQKGDADASDFSKDAQDTAKSMKPSDAKDFASTKHAGLPKKVKGENKLKEIIRQTYRESLRESVILTEKQFKGLEGIPDNKSLEKITDAQKLKIIKAPGNIIDFHVPADQKSKRNFWQVISSGKILTSSKSSIVMLKGKGFLNSPVFDSMDDLIKGVDWKSMEEKRRFNKF